MHGIETKSVEFLTQVIQGIGWPDVAVIMVPGSTHIPIPSEVTMPLAGWMLVHARGASAWQAVWLGGLFGAIGCTIGSALRYWMGAWGGHICHHMQRGKRRAANKPMANGLWPLAEANHGGEAISNQQSDLPRHDHQIP